MLNVSSNWYAAIRSINRSFTFIVTVNGVQLDGSKIKSIKITETGVSSKTLSPGEFSKNSCELVVTSDNGQSWEDRSFTATMAVSGSSDTVPMGKFWTNTIKDQDSGYAFKIVAYSRDPWWDEEYQADNGLTAVSDILDFMESRSGTPITGRNLITLASIDAVPQGTTNAQLLGYLAGYNGYSVRTTRTGGIELFRYIPIELAMPYPSETLYPSSSLYPGAFGNQSTVVNYRIHTNEIFEGGLSVEKDTTINSYMVQNDTGTISVGAGYGVEYVNPYLKTDEEVEAMALYLNETYTPLAVKWRGDPALEIGDIVTVDSSTGYVMEQVFEIDGGLKHTIKSYSGEAKQLVLGSSMLERKIRNAYAGMLQELQKVFAGLFSATNGYFSFIDKDRNPLTIEDIVNAGKTPAGFRISDEPEITPTTCGWEFVLGGLYNSTDGFRSVSNIALTNDGYIVGDRILAKSISAQALSVAVQTILENVDMNFDFAEDGLHVAKKDTNGNITSTYQVRYGDMGMRVMLGANASGDPDADSTLIAEGDSVIASNLTADQYLRVRANNVSSRFQQWYSSVHQEYEFGIFWEV